MRRDMPHVLVDEPRNGDRAKYRRSKARRLLRDDPDRLPRREGMRRAWLDSKWPKEFGDHVRPLERWLDAQCGRPWDNVRAEIAAVAKKRTLRGLHLWQHVGMLVTERPLVVDGRFRCSHVWRAWTDFVVDPQTGRLRRNPW